MVRSSLCSASPTNCATAALMAAMSSCGLLPAAFAVSITLSISNCWWSMFSASFRPSV